MNNSRKVLKIWENCITNIYDRAKRPENLEIETEEKENADNKNPYILHSGVEKSVKKTQNKKAAGDDNVSGKYSKCLDKMISK